MIGSLPFAEISIRPNIAYAVNVLSLFSADSSEPPRSYLQTLLVCLYPLTRLLSPSLVSESDYSYR
jgi:hypothetical protein